MNSKEMKFQISDLLAEQLEMYADRIHVSIELAVEPILQWTMKEFEHQLAVIHSKFDQEQLEWFREHIDILNSSFGVIVSLPSTTTTLMLL